MPKPPKVSFYAEQWLRALLAQKRYDDGRRSLIVERQEKSDTKRDRIIKALRAQNVRDRDAGRAELELIEEIAVACGVYK